MDVQGQDGGTNQDIFMYVIRVSSLIFNTEMWLIFCISCINVCLDSAVSIALAHVPQGPNFDTRLRRLSI